MSWSETYLVNAIFVKEMLAFGQLPNFFGHLVIAQADQAAFSVLDLNGACAIHSFCDQRAGILDKSEQPASQVDVVLSGDWRFDGSQQRRKQNHVLIGGILRAKSA